MATAAMALLATSAWAIATTVAPIPATTPAAPAPSTRPAPSGAPSALPAPAPPTAPPTAERAPSSSSPTGGETSADQEGSFTVRQTATGDLVRWACDEPIEVMLAEPAPPGAREQLDTAVNALAEASGLPLTLEAAGSGSTITVTYGPLPHASPRVVGQGGVSYDPATGMVTNGRVTMRTDGTLVALDTPEHLRALLHELAHAAGVLHAAEGEPELMAPTLANGITWDNALDLGPGDRAALDLVGCTP